MAKDTYDVGSIEWLQGVEAIQRHPGNYAGAVDGQAINHCVAEIVDNCNDEASNGNGDAISITVDKAGYITVADQGRGIPVGPHPKNPKIDTLTLIFTELHAGGKSNKNSSGYSSGTGGVHGLGVTVVNALSETLEVWTFRKKWWHQSFKEGKPSSKVIKQKPPKVFGHKGDCGTIIRFKPNTSLLTKGSKLDTSKMIEWIKSMSWFSYCNKVKGDKVVSRKPVTFYLDIKGKQAKIRRGGMEEYFRKTLEINKLDAVAFEEPFVLQTKNLDLVIGWCNDDGDYFTGLTNVIKNISGGTHVKAVHNLIVETFKKYSKRSDKYRPDDLFAGMVGAINLRIKHPRFSSQDKVKLVSDEANDIVVADVKDAFTKWAKKNKASVIELIERANEIGKVNDALKNNRKLAAALKVKKGGKTLLPEKMLVSHTKIAAERELFLVEGDSAKGSCKDASDRKFQEVLPLRGKMTNVMKSKKANKDEGKKKKGIDETLINILKATGISPEDGTSKMRVGKIMLLMDADADGAHIAALLLSVFLTYAPNLFKEGKVFFVDTPLYVHQTKSGVKTYAKDYEKLLEKVGADKIDAVGSTLTRAKGLGELNADVMEQVAFNKDTRQVWHISAEEAKGRVKKIMGDDRDAVKEMLGV